MSDLKNPAVLAVNLSGDLLDKITRYAQEDAKLAALAAFSSIDRDQYLAQEVVCQRWAEATARVLLRCFKPPQGTALAEAIRARSDAWHKTRAVAPPMVFTDEAWALVGKSQS